MVRILLLKKIVKKILGRNLTQFAARKISGFPKKLTISKNSQKFNVICSNLRYYNFWNQYPEWENETFKIFDKFLKYEFSYIDIGSWIGPTVLYGCQKSKHCFALEPDPVAYKELLKNIGANPIIKEKISVFQKCIADHNGVFKFYPRDGILNNAGGSSSSLSGDGKYFWEVSGNTLSEFIISNSIKNCNFIKIDVEGAEFMIISNSIEFLKNFKPTLLIELHPMFVTEPLLKIKNLYNTLKIYKKLYDSNFNEITYESLMNIELSKTKQIIATDLDIEK